MGSAISPWSPAPLTPWLDVDEVHVWRASLDLPGLDLEALQWTLAVDELQRAQRFKFRVERDRFIAGRGLLRVILGKYLRLHPRQVPLSYGSHGKPLLDTRGTYPTLFFNLSHSRGLALFSVSQGRANGVDLEYIPRNIDCFEIGDRFLSPREINVLRSLSQPIQQAAFISCWARKEAYLKATGEGLSVEMDQFEVTGSHGELVLHFRTGDGLAEASRWTLQDLPIEQGYRAALCVEGHGWRLRCWDWFEAGVA